MFTRLKHAKILKIAVYLFIATSAIFLLAPLSGVLAANLDLGLNYPAGTGLSNELDIRIIIARIIRVVIGFLGIIAVGLIIYAGWLWMTSAGNEEKIEQAKKILKNAVIGLIIILSAFAIASFILNMLSGAAGGGPNGPGNGPPTNYGLSALGNGIIESHYPARDQKEVPRNTSIIITFREPILANTLCATAGTACNGELTNQSVIRIFKQSEEAICVAGATPSSQCTSLVEAKVYSTDGKTFVFMPINYLGSPSEYINYTVYLGKGLLRQSGEKAFPGAGGDYGWSFEVSNKIDLTPPIVKNNGVFPPPDNAKDITDASAVAVQARGTITVGSGPSIARDASVSVTKDGDSPVAGVEINKTCQRNGNFSVDIKTGPIATLYQGAINLGQGTFSAKDGKKQAVFSECNLTLTLSSAADNFAVGNLWNLVLNKATTADTITVGNITYTASNIESGTSFKVWGVDENTAGSIRSVLASNPEVDVLVSATKVVTIKAKIAGIAGNSIDLSSSSSTRLPVVVMAGGTDKVNKVTVNGRKDQPMNTAIQINFNEAIMPLTVSGTADEVKDFIRVVNAGGELAGGAVCQEDFNCKSGNCTNGRCLGNDLKTDGTLCQKDTECVSYKCEGTPKKCVSDVLAGKFAISNQYSTVEFLSDKECGFNNCGEKIYCLPANSHLKVELKAAKLVDCGADNCASKSPFNTCDSDKPACKDVNNKYYPQADPAKLTTVDGGIVDAAFNSLDGNRDGSAYGPASYYDENNPSAIGNGDNYKWSFFISDVIDLTPPKIKTTTPIINGPGVDLTSAVKISFDKLMLSSRLTTGSLTIQNGTQSILHYLLNLRSFIDQPLGYWVTNIRQQNVVNGEFIDSTDVYINHSPFNTSSTYKAQAGSGLKDIYQNCFLPCSSESLTGNPSCCNGVPQDKASCP